MQRPDEKISDDLIQALRRGDRQAFKAIFLRFHHAISRFLWLRVRSSLETEELLQEVFWNFWQNRDALHSGSNIELELYRAAHACVAEAEPQFPPQPEEALPEQDAPALSTAREPLGHHFDALAARLPEPTRTILFLNRYESKTLQEIAAILRISPRKAAQELHRAIATLEQKDSSGTEMENRRQPLTAFFHRFRPNIIRLFLKWQTGTLYPWQQARLNHWLKKPEHRRRWQRLLTLWTSLRCPATPPDIPASVLWVQLENRLVDALAAGKDENTKPAVKRSNRSYVISLITAVIFLMIFFGFLARHWLLSPHLTSVNVQPAERRSVLLPDYTRVELNSATSLQYPDNLATGFRQVFLTGEAFFSVDAARQPFEVRTDAGLVRAIDAAAFNLRVRGGKGHLYVESGLVTVWRSSALSSPADTVQAGETIVFSARGIRRLPSDAARHLLAWRNGELHIENLPAGEALAEMGRHYGQIFYIATELDSMRVTAHFRDESAEEACAIIAEKLGLSWWKTRLGFALGKR